MTDAYTISQGDRLTIPFTSTDPDAGSYRWAFALWARPTEPLIIAPDLEVTDGTPDTFTVDVPPSVTRHLQPGRYAWELKALVPGAVGPDTVRTGSVTVTASALLDLVGLPPVDPPPDPDAPPAFPYVLPFTLA